MMRSLLFLAVLLIILTAAPVTAATYLVKPDDTGDFPTIQAAVSAAVNGDTINLGDGTFRGEGNRNVDYSGKAITIRSQSADPSVCVIDCQGNGVENRRAFLFETGEGWDSVLEGVTITNGYGASHGGAIRGSESFPTINNCRFTHNRTAADGGCLYGWRFDPYVTECTFIGNTADDGGASWTDGSFVTFLDCTFTENSCREGGAISGQGGGLYLVGCNFNGNHASSAGGAILWVSSSHSEFTNCSFSDCRATAGGGAVYFIFCHATFNNCTFTRNRATDPNYVLNGGGAIGGDASNVELVGCTINDNISARYGGGIVCNYDATCRLTDCTLYGNQAVGGSGLWLGQESSATLDNVIVAFGIDGEGILCDGSFTPTLDCCDVYGNDGGDWIDCIQDQYGINGNISEDPLFCSPEGGILTLHSDSPCAQENSPDCGQIGAHPVGCGPSTDVLTDLGAVKNMGLRLASPNPFEQSTRIDYVIPQDMENPSVRLGVYDPGGRLIRILVDGAQHAGSYSIIWDGRDQNGAIVPSGAYFCRLHRDGKAETVRLRVLR